MTVHPVGARPQLAFKMPTLSLRTVMEPQEHVLRAVTCMICMSRRVALGTRAYRPSSKPLPKALAITCSTARTPGPHPARQQLLGCDMLRSGTTSGGRVLNKCAHFSQLAAVPLD